MITVMVALAGATCFATVASANVEVSERDFGQSFLSLTQQFSLSDYYSAEKTERGAVLYKYRSKAGEPQSDATAATVSVFAVKDPAQFLFDYIRKVQSEGGPRREIGKVKLYGEGEDLVGYTTYYIGKGPIENYFMSMIWETAPGVVANFQIEKKEAPFAESTVQRFEQIVLHTVERKDGVQKF